MFNKNNNKEVENELIKQLKNRIFELETQLNEVANDNGSIIIKQLPSGQIELNGEPVDKDSPVDYYNSSKATYGELTMYRVAKEALEREKKKLINMHIEECDRYKNEIENLQAKLDLAEQTITNYTKDMNDKLKYIEELKIKLDNTIHQYEEKLAYNESNYNEQIDKYKKFIDALESDITLWKNRFLSQNNVLEDGTIITKYGKIISTNNEEEM